MKQQELIKGSAWSSLFVVARSAFHQLWLAWATCDLSYRMSDIISASSSTFPTLLLQNTVLKMTWGFQPSQNVGIKWLADSARWNYISAEITYLLWG